MLLLAEALIHLLAKAMEKNWNRERVLPLVFRITSVMLKDEFYRHVLKVSRMFNAGEYTEDEDLEFVEKALAARVALERLRYEEVRVELEMLDNEYATAYEAVMALPKKSYYHYLERVADPPPKNLWWTARRDLDRELPESFVKEALT